MPCLFGDSKLKAHITQIGLALNRTEVNKIGTAKKRELVFFPPQANSVHMGLDYLKFKGDFSSSWLFFIPHSVSPV